ncbi:hypothetical protein NDU88_001751 [Pleurodeles waltl]|uniref:Uncharacterized protein n=1 Tax=Pleurodeles waltl TaxID=8319 RepID=A0AAV7S888_PLEWA|nr:hypothetical protein NDU88_001751 [Pleurodeles waltl]
MGLEEDLQLEDFKEVVGAKVQCKAPGLYGLLVEYYQRYSDLLLPRLLDSLQESRQLGSMLRAMREAKIVILPKPNRDPEDPSSYKLLSMLCVDNKILAKVLAAQLGRIVTHLVYGDQCLLHARQCDQYEPMEIFPRTPLDNGQQGTSSGGRTRY